MLRNRDSRVMTDRACLERLLAMLDELITLLKKK